MALAAVPIAPPLLGVTTVGGVLRGMSYPLGYGEPGLRLNYRSTIPNTETVVRTNRFYVTYLLL